MTHIKSGIRAEEVVIPKLRIIIGLHVLIRRSMLFVNWIVKMSLKTYDYVVIVF